jgi:hypothetical protein
MLPFIGFKIKDDRLLVGTKVYNIDGALIAEIEESNWRPNKNFTGKFNYDDRGFEVIDNNGNIVISINMINDYLIQLQGIFSYNRHVYTYGLASAIDNANRPNFRQEVQESIRNCRIQQLFEYTGKDWLHKRKK